MGGTVADLHWSFGVLVNIHSPPGTIVMAIVSVVLETTTWGRHGGERGDMGLDPQNKEECLAAKRAVAQVGGEDFGPSYRRKLGADTLLLRDSWQSCVLPYRLV